MTADSRYRVYRLSLYKSKFSCVLEKFSNETEENKKEI